MNLGKESETLEFEKTTREIKEGMVSIASILNKHGVGTLYFGVKPNGDVMMFQSHHLEMFQGLYMRQLNHKYIL